MFAQTVPRASLAGKAVPMDLRSRHVRSNCPASPTTPDNTRSMSAGSERFLRNGDRSNDARVPQLKPRDLLLTTTVASVTAGALYWRSTRSLPMSLGAILIVAMIGIAVAWLYAREETRRVEAREHGSTEREKDIRHCDKSSWQRPRNP